MLFRNPETEEEIETYSFFEDNDTMSSYEMLDHLLYRGFVEVLIDGVWYSWEVMHIYYHTYISVPELFLLIPEGVWLYTPLWDEE